MEEDGSRTAVLTTVVARPSFFYLFYRYFAIILFDSLKHGARSDAGADVNRLPAEASARPPGIAPDHALLNCAPLATPAAPP